MNVLYNLQSIKKKHVNNKLVNWSTNLLNCKRNLFCRKTIYNSSTDDTFDLLDITFLKQAEHSASRSLCQISD